MASRTLIRHHQVRNSDDYDDTLAAGPTLETDAETVEDDLNALRSQLRRITGKPSWVDAPSASAVALNSLLLYIEEGPVEGFASSYKEIVGTPWPTSITWYTDPTKVAKIYEKLVTRNVNQAPTVIVYRLYDTDGVTPLVTATDTITNTGVPAVFEISRVRVIT
jgi:hypothetical protein